MILAATCLLVTFQVCAQTNGNLQIHFMDVGQGDGALLISPGGQTVLFDDGRQGVCDKPTAYLQKLGIQKIDYHIVSHYHLDHIGCAQQVFQIAPLQIASYDRGGSYNSSTYTSYVAAVGAKRKTATDGMVLTLDQNSPTPVTLKVVSINGNGISTTNENDLSVSVLVTFGAFKAEIGGDLSGEKALDYEDIESSVAPKVGQIDVYKVHHHCSSYSTNTTWIGTVQPRIGIVSVGDGNSYHHPADDCLERLHNGGVKLYWTETGAGGTPEPNLDTIAGTIIVQVAAGATTYTVTYGSNTDTYPLWSAPSPATHPTGTPKYAWSKKSNIYHFADCRVVTSIKPENLERGDSPPPGKTLHQLCPQH
jgi:beta-lactamase superfamily II metal-dependent hydrolase